MPVLGRGAYGGLGCLGLTGLGPVFFRRRAGKVIMDERDTLIQQRSWLAAYILFWVVFVLVAVVLSPWYYGQTGAVPVLVVQMSVAWGFMLVYGVNSIATLVQYRGGSQNADERA
jgi:hypothetical protein